jgi:hypothetical protein
MEKNKYPSYENKKPIENNKCRMPTYHNPFMNYILYTDDNLEACEYKKTKQQINEEYNKHVHKDANDIWGKNMSDLIFYTMPNTKSVNEQSKFANWLYGK